MSEGTCAWFGFEKDALRAYVDERSPQPKYFCNKDVQTIIVHYLQCVKLSEIKTEEPWNNRRLETIRGWATPDRLRRAKLVDHKVGTRTLPDVSRSGHFPEIEKMQYEISDGIHRIAVARELGVDCILCDVEEGIDVRRGDTHLYKTY